MIPSLRELYGYNELSVSSPEHVLLKFAKTIYESPLIMLLFGSAVVSALMGNVDDAVSITVAILIVLTGQSSSASHYTLSLPSEMQLVSSKNKNQRNHWRP